MKPRIRQIILWLAWWWPGLARRYWMTPEQEAARASSHGHAEDWPVWRISACMKQHPYADMFYDRHGRWPWEEA
jgi:hypothetical protein